MLTEDLILLDVRENPIMTGCPTWPHTAINIHMLPSSAWGNTKTTTRDESSNMSWTTFDKGTKGVKTIMTPMLLLIDLRQS